MNNIRSISLLVFILQFSGITLFSQQQKWFDDKDLTLVGAYYYPEQWCEHQWDRDLKNMADLGFDFTHFGEFAWANIEPREGEFDFTWLDKAVDIAKTHNLKVIMCTSTATPPVWLTRKHPEILLQDEYGYVLDHGARQHASFSSPIYREYALKMIEKLAKHYGNNETIIGWQLDNEPDVQYDYSNLSLSEFRKYLTIQYNNDIQNLNRKWGTSFWSQTYSSFDQINFPQMKEPLTNPHHILDFRRYAAFQTNSFLDSQSQMIKKYSKNQWVTTNYIPRYDEGNIGGCNYLDFESYTRYMVHGEDPKNGEQSYRIGDPLRITKPNDLFRSVSGVYGVMELQPGQVNWGKINPQPIPGAVRLWLWTVFSGGSDFICTYRFRQPLSGIEQYHYGIIGTDGISLSSGGEEFKKFIDEVKFLRKHYSPKEDKPKEYLIRKAAILFNHENSWNIDRQKQNETWNTNKHIDKYYSALKSFGAPVDFINEDSDFSNYPIIIAPAYQMIDDELVNKWKNYVQKGGCLILTCRTGHKNKSGQLFEMKYAEKIYDLIGAEIEFYDLLPPDYPGRVKKKNNELFSWNTWGDIITPKDKNTSIIATYDSEFYNGKAAAIKHDIGEGIVVYVGVDSSDGILEKRILADVYNELNIQILDLPKGVIIEYRNGFGIVMNYSSQTFNFSLSVDSKVLIGNPIMKTTDVVVFKTK